MKVLGMVIMTAVLCLGLPFAAIHALAQSPTSTIVGTVKDPSGAILPGAKVTVRNVETNVIAEKPTDDSGRFSFPGLRIGNYEVAVDVAGFDISKTRPFALRLDSQNVPITLKVANGVNRLTVLGDVPMVNSRDSQGGKSFERGDLTGLPIPNLGALGNGNRDIRAIGISVQGVNQLNKGDTGAPTGVDLSANGSNARSNTTKLDGQNIGDPTATGSGLPMNNPDAIEEVQIITNQFAAENGGATGAIVSVVTKGGTNDWHGSTFWYHNSNHLNSRSNLDESGGFKSAPFRIENQIGGTLGGPIVRNRTFFFVTGQRYTDRNNSSGLTINSAPTEAGRALLQANGGDRTTVRTLLNNLPAAQGGETARVGYCFNPAAWTGSAAPPAATQDPNNPGQFLCSLAGWTPIAVPVGKFNNANLIRYNDWQGSARLDHNFTNSHSLSVRYMFNDDLLTGVGQATPPGIANTVPSRSQAATIGLISPFSPTFFNEFRVSWSRYAFYTGPQNPAALTVPSIEITDLGLTGFNSITPRNAIGYPSNLPEGRRNNIFQFTDNMTWTHGAHTAKWGVDIQKQQLASESNPNVRGQLLYSNLTDFVADFADKRATLNRPLPGGEFVMHFNWTDWSFFAQDDWKVAHNLTLNLGLRYELPGNPIDSLYPINDRIVAANGGDPLFRYNSRPPRDTNNLMPRIGFNWNLGETGVGLLKKLDLRGGYARTHDNAFLIMAIQTAASFPFQAGFNLLGKPGTMDAMANPSNQTLNLATAPMLSQTVLSPDFHTPYSDQYSLELQREVTNNDVFTARYVGTKGNGLFQSLEGNPITRCGIPNCSSRVDPARGVIRVRANTGSSIYHSMQLSFDHRSSRGISGGVYYTRSTYIDNGSDIVNPSSSEVATPQDPFNRNDGERARSTYDRPNRLTGNLVYELPSLKERRALGRILGGLQVGTLTMLQSGAPFTVFNGSDPGNVLFGSLTGSAIRPNFAPNVNVAQLRNMSVSEIRSRVIEAGSPAVFFRALTTNGGPTPAAPIGNVPRNLLRSDGIVSIDFNVVKNFTMEKGRSIQLRADIFNLPNTRNFGIPINTSATATASSFLDEGATDGGNRRMFVSLRFGF